MRAETEAKGRLPHPRALFIYARGMGTLFVAGANTGAAEMLRLVGAVNVGAPLEGYKPFTAEAVATSGAEVIVLPEKGLQSLGGIEALLALPGMSQTPAARARRVVTVDDALLLGFGPRLPKGFRCCRAQSPPVLPPLQPLRRCADRVTRDGGPRHDRAATQSV